MSYDRDEDGPGAEVGRGKFGAFGISDMMKKAAFAAIGAAFMTEESVRGYVAESKLPREIAKYVIQNASQAKEQFFGYLAKEMTGLVKKSDLPAVASAFLREHTIELEAKIRFRANGTPDVQLGQVRASAGTPATSNGSAASGATAAMPSTGSPSGSAGAQGASASSSTSSPAQAAASAGAPGAAQPHAPVTPTEPIAAP